MRTTPSTIRLNSVLEERLLWMEIRNIIRNYHVPAIESTSPPLRLLLIVFGARSLSTSLLKLLLASGVVSQSLINGPYFPIAYLGTLFSIQI